MRLLLLLLLVFACGRSVPKLGGSSPVRAGDREDGGRSDAAPIDPPDTGVLDTGPADTGACSGPEVGFYSERSVWLQRAGQTSREEFELEGVGALQLPHATEQGVRFEGESPLIVAVLGPSPTFPSKAIHVRDFSSGIRIELPRATTAFGFEYYTTDEGWLLSVPSGRMNIPSEMTRVFAGLVIECGSFDSFGLQGRLGAQGGIILDNVEWR